MPEIAVGDPLAKIERPLWDSINGAVKAELAAKPVDANAVHVSVKLEDGRYRTAVAAKGTAGDVATWEVVGWVDVAPGEKPSAGIEGAVRF